MNIKAALQQRAKELNIALPKLLQHYAMERFLYRLSLSPVADRFYLKDGMLLMGVGAGTARTTMDIDLLGRISIPLRVFKKQYPPSFIRSPE